MAYAFSSRRLVFRAGTSAARAGKRCKRTKGTRTAIFARGAGAIIVAFAAVPGRADGDGVGGTGRDGDNSSYAAGAATTGTRHKRATTATRAAARTTPAKHLNNAHSRRGSPVSVRSENLHAFGTKSLMPVSGAGTQATEQKAW